MKKMPEPLKIQPSTPLAFQTLEFRGLKPIPGTEIVDATKTAATKNGVIGLYFLNDGIHDFVVVCHIPSVTNSSSQALGIPLPFNHSMCNKEWTTAFINFCCHFRINRGKLRELIALNAP